MKRLAIVFAALAAWPTSAAASSRIVDPMRPCFKNSVWLCGDISVPLDWQGRVRGRVKLAVAWRHVPGARRPAVLGLTGGPGQGTLNFYEVFRDSLLPVLDRYDILLIDGRGTGQSQPLRCPALQKLDIRPRTIRACASRLGRRARFYSSEDTVRDFEAVRRILRIPSLVPYGISYGTKVAMQYASRYPQHTDRLLLDSVVLPDGGDIFGRSTLQAVPQVAASLCSWPPLCEGVASDPANDLVELLRRIRADGGMQATLYDARGRKETFEITEDALISTWVDADFFYDLRRRLPGEIHAALNGDPTQLAVELSIPSSESDVDAPSDFSVALFVATSCADAQQLPWPASWSSKRREAQLWRTLRQTPREQFEPWSRGLAFRLGVGSMCIAWPASPRSAPQRPLPQVPTLVLSGQHDLRTPTADAQLLVEQLSQGQLVVVPSTGHDALHSSDGPCPSEQVTAFLSEQPLPPCRAAEFPTNLRELEPALPANIEAVTPEPGVADTDLGQVLAAIRLGLGWMIDDVTAYSNIFDSYSKRGGLRGGWVGPVPKSDTKVRLHDYQAFSKLKMNGLLEVGPTSSSIGPLHVEWPGGSGQVEVSEQAVLGQLNGVSVQGRPLGTEAQERLVELSHRWEAEVQNAARRPGVQLPRTRAPSMISRLPRWSELR